MRYVKDKVTKGNREWRIVAQTDSLETLVVGENLVARAFASEREAYDYVIGQFLKTSAFRDMQPGQNYSIQMADGTARQVQVKTQTPQAVNVTDSQTGESMMIPHVEQGADPQPTQPAAPATTAQPTQWKGQPGPGQVTPGPQGEEIGSEDSSIQHVPPPGQNKRQYALNGERWDKRKTPEKPPCPVCGGPGIHEGAFGGRRYYRCHSCGMYFSRRQYSLSRRDAKVFSEECLNCGSHTRMLDDDGKCPSCRRKGSRITAREILATAPMPELQAMPSASVANDSQTQLRDQMNEKSPSDFAEEEESVTKPSLGRKRELTPHEIIDEAESLIRNALTQGVRIGVNELQDYMQQEYDNMPDELLKGIALAWQKVEYEEAHEEVAPQLGAQGPIPKEKLPDLVPSNAPLQSPKMGFRLCAQDDEDDDYGLSDLCKSGECRSCKSYSCECSCHESQEYES